jgi:hypothetical protein
MKRRQFLALSIASALHASLARATPVDPALLKSLGTQIPAVTLDGTATTLAAADIGDLAAGMRGTVLLPGDGAYDAARMVWNGRYDRRPALIARCESPADVMQAVNFAREHRLLTAVKAGGHSATGKSTCDGGIMIDLTQMNGVRVDPIARFARIESGTLLKELDSETRQFGLVTTAGTVGHTGAAGLTLGGGLGRVGRRFGLACDNLRAADIVTADGRLLHVSPTENPDLLWGLRGGGGNFGVVTSFEYGLHEMNPMILGGNVTWPQTQLREVLRFLADYTPGLPDELNLDIGTAGRGKDGIVEVEVCWSGDHAAGERVIAPLRAFGSATGDTVAPMPYTTLQTVNDEASRHGQKSSGRSGFVPSLTPALIDTIADLFENDPARPYSMMFQHSGGAIARVPVDGTAFPNRTGKHWLMLSTGWREEADAEPRMAALKSAWAALEPHTEGFYVNSMAEDQYARVRQNYGPNYERLVTLKRKYDPGNQFRLNANVVP